MKQPATTSEIAVDHSSHDDNPPTGHGLRKSLMRGVSIVAVLALAGCSSTPDYLNPAEWYESASDSVSSWWDDDGDAKPAEAQSKVEPKADENYPKLSSVPEKPTGTATQAELDKVREGLMADKANAKYTENAEQPKITSGAPPVKVQSTASAAPKPAAAALSNSETQADAALSVRTKSSMSVEEVSKNPEISSPEIVAKAADPDLPAPTSDEMVNKTRETDGMSKSLKSSDPEASKLWPNTPAPIAVGKSTLKSKRIRSTPMKSSSSMASTNRASTAEASYASTDREEPQQVAAVPQEQAPAPQMAATTESSSMEQSKDSASEAGSQSVIVNPDAIYDTYTPTESYEIGVVTFAHGSANLSNRDRQIIAQSVATWKERGGRIRVVGHASSRTGDMDLANHMLANLNISLTRANNVASELIRQGVDPQYLMVDARGDSDPRYYEVMPAGEAGNRRAEIFIDY